MFCANRATSPGHQQTPTRRKIQAMGRTTTVADVVEAAAANDVVVVVEAVHPRRDAATLALQTAPAKGARSRRTRSGSRSTATRTPPIDCSRPAWACWCARIALRPRGTGRTDRSGSASGSGGSFRAAKVYITYISPHHLAALSYQHLAVSAVVYRNPSTTIVSRRTDRTHARGGVGTGTIQYDCQ